MLILCLVHCEKNGVTCSGQGVCGLALMGCFCDAEEIGGHYCERSLSHEEIIDNRSAATKVYGRTNLLNYLRLMTIASILSLIIL